MSTSATSPESGESASGTGGVSDLKEKVAEKTSDVMETVRGKTGNLQAQVADWLDSSARVIRSRGTSATEVAGEKLGDAAAERLVQSGETAATVLEQGAMWLRENDLSDVEARVTSHLKANPARSLLIAAGVGFLISRRRS